MYFRGVTSVVLSGALLLAAWAVPAVADDSDGANLQFGAYNPGSDPVESPARAPLVCPKDPATGLETCTVGSRRWNGRCYAGVAADQPAADDPLWNGHRDAAGNPDGVILDCLPKDCAFADGQPGNVDGTINSCGILTQFWASGAPGQVTPRVLAEWAVARMHIQAPQIGMTGGVPPDGMQWVNLPAWMWAADPGDSTTGPITASAADGGTTVTATAVLDKTVWSMGDGVSITCAGANAAGTPFEDRYAGLPSPTCGYTYTRTSAHQPNEAFTVTVRAYWTVTWSGGGQSGTIPVQVYRSIQKRVGEVQVLNVPNPGGGS